MKDVKNGPPVRRMARSLPREVCGSSKYLAMTAHPVFRLHWHHFQNAADIPITSSFSSGEPREATDGKIACVGSSDLLEEDGLGGLRDRERIGRIHQCKPRWDAQVDDSSDAVLRKYSSKA